MKQLLLTIQSILLCLFFHLYTYAQSHVEIQKEGQDARMYVDNQRYIIRGVCYAPIPKGGTSATWENIDTDIALMQQAGINTIRTYSPIIETSVLDKLANGGIRIIMGFGYSDPSHPYKIVDGTYIDYVNQYKNHPAILMWEFGNEYNYHTYPTAEGGWFDGGAMEWFNALQSAASTTKAADPNHPISTAHGEKPTQYGNMSADPIAVAPDVDVWGMNVYRWTGSSGAIWDFWYSFNGQDRVKGAYLSEAGSDSYDVRIMAENQLMHAEDMKEILTQALTAVNPADGKKIIDCGLGITLFQFTDGWNKTGNPGDHDVGNVDLPGSFPQDNYNNEEWFGITTINREPKQAFYEVASIYNQLKNEFPDAPINNGGTNDAVTGVGLDRNNVTLGVGERTTLIATVSPSTASNKNVIWSSTNSSVGTDMQGNIIGNHEGQATIFATTEDGNFVASCTVTVGQIVTPPTCDLNIQQEAEHYSLMSGIQLEATTDVGGGENVGWIETDDWLKYNIDLPACTYTISYRVASMSSGGIIELKSGNKILHTSNVPQTNGWQNWVEITEEVVITEPISEVEVYAVSGGFNLNWIKFEGQASPQEILPTAINLSTSDLNLFEGASTQLSATVSPSDATNQIVSWTSSNPSIVTVDQSGFITAQTEGTAQITATTHNQISTSIVITVQKESTNTCDFEAHIEAETYTASAGVDKEATTDIGGGENVGWIDAGDWMVWPANIPACDYKITYRVASAGNGGTIQLEEAGGQNIFGQVTIPVTGGWQTWVDVTQEITITNAITELAIFTPDGGFNLNWIKIEPLNSEYVPVTSINALNCQSLLEIGQTFALNIEILPLDTTDKSVSFASSDETIATVDANGLVEAIANGNVVITVTSNDGPTTTCSILVNEDTPPQEGLSLIWEDNFDGNVLNSDHWVLENSNGCDIGLCGFGNQELQAYTNRSENVRVENGKLVLAARRENLMEREFTSGKVMTREKVNIAYGVVEASIKLPDMNNGLWPAFWMLNTRNNWPYTGEIDIMEAGASAIQNDANEEVKANIFWRAEDAGADANLQWGNEDAFSYYTGAQSGNQAHEAFFIYRLYWTPDYVRITIMETDLSGEGIPSTEYEMLKIDSAPTFENEFFSGDNFYVILNLAVGGWFPFNPDNGENTAANVTALPTAGSEKQMLIDYVRVYSLDGIGQVSSGPGYSPAVPAPKFGIYGDDTATAYAMTFGLNSELWGWSGTETLISDVSSPYGTTALSFTMPANTWSGMGINSSDVLNLSNYQGGTLRFKAKTSSQESFRIHTWTRTGGREVQFIAGQENYGLIRDGQWHDVEVPLDLLVDNLSEVIRPFIIGEISGTTPSSDLNIVLDEIHYATSSSNARTASYSIDLEDEIIMNAYPNPVTELLTISGDLKQFNILKVFSIDGKEYLTLKIENKKQIELKMNHLQKGVYFIQLANAEKVKSIKVVKQ